MTAIAAWIALDFTPTAMCAAFDPRPADNHRCIVAIRTVAYAFPFEQRAEPVPGFAASAVAPAARLGAGRIGQRKERGQTDHTSSHNNIPPMQLIVLCSLFHTLDSLIGRTTGIIEKIGRVGRQILS